MNTKEQFEQNGFAIVGSFIVGNELMAVKNELDRFIAEDLHSLPPEYAFFEDLSNQASLKQIQKLHLHSTFFGELFSGKPRTLAEELLGENVIPKNLQYFNKPPRHSRPTPPHQDGFYFMIKPCSAVTLWLALDAVDEENGCVRYVRGSHVKGMRHHKRTQTLGFSQGIADFDANEITTEEACTAQPGDLLVHHAMTIHRADANQSTTRQRRALGFTYFGESAREDTAAQAAYQDRLKREMTEAGRI
tara:strand:- start:1094 stop:1834 length:741 start_codon:yes stop_codon:yes gene_type:complete